MLHDFGGPRGLTWAAARPDRVASLTLINVGVLLGYRWHYLARIWRMPLPSPGAENEQHLTMK